MNRKTKIFIAFLIGIIIIQAFGNYNLFNALNEKKINVSTKQTKTFKNVAIMYETEEGSGEYTPASNTVWPTEGYKYNTTLSKCENGSVMTYDKTNNKVNVASNVSDKCYVYFDVYDPIKITNVEVSNLWGGIFTINVTATSEEGSISKYYYSINNGESYTEGTSASHTFTGLSGSTTYNVKIKLVDNINNEKIYSTTVTTKELVLISMTMDGIVYQAEDGMTWKDWLDSPYNTGPYYYIENRGYISHRDFSVTYYGLAKKNATIAENADNLIISNAEYSMVNTISLN